MYLDAKKLVLKLKATLPLRVVLTDPLSGELIDVSHDNVLELLMVDAPTIVEQGQIVAAQYAEFARLHRAAQYAHECAQVSLRAWKARRAQALRKRLADKGEKKPTTNEIEDDYRTHAEYETEYQKVAQWSAMAGLFDDIKRAFATKANVLREQQRTIDGYERAQQAYAQRG